MKSSVPQPVVIILIVIGFLIAALGGYFLLLGPQRSQAASLNKQITDTQSSIDSARALTLQAKEGAKIRVADIFRLTKAMPDQTDMAGILLELNQVAQADGVTLRLARVKPQVLAVLDADGLVATFGADRVHGNVDQAIEAQLAEDARHGVPALSGA